VRALSFNLITSVFIQVLGVASGVLLARLLGPTGRGELAAVFLWAGIIAAFGMLSLNESIVFNAASKEMTVDRIISSSLAIFVVIIPILIIVGYIVVPFAYGKYRPEVQLVAYIYLAYIPLHVLAALPVSLFQGTLRLAEWNATRALVHLAYLIGIAGAAFAGLVSVRVFAIAMLSAILLDTLVAYILLWRLRYGLSAPKLKDMIRLLRFGLKVHIDFMGRFLNQLLDQTAISILLLASDLGLYVVAVTISRGVAVVSGTIESVAFPKIAIEDSHENKSLMLGRFMKVTILLVITVSVSLIILTDWILVIFFGEAFAPAAPIVYLLILANIPLSGSLLFSSAFKGFGKPVIAGKAQAIGLVILVISMAILLPTLGTIGAALSVLIVHSCTCAVLAFWASRHLGIRLSSLIIPTKEDFLLLKQKLRRVV